MRASIDYLYALAESLIRQGFKRIIWTSLHGPASVFIGPVVRDIFETHKVSMLYIDPIQVLSSAEGGIMGAFAAMGGRDPFGHLTVAAYDILGRLGDVPLTTPETAYWSTPQPSSVEFASDLLGQAFGSSPTAYYFAEMTDHMYTQALLTEQDVLAAAERGRVGFEAIVSRIPIEKLVDDLTALARYNEAVMERYPSTRSIG